jgi:O-succinylbenzoic acid--CoA ligase
MTRRLVALDLPGGEGFVTALRRVWDRGDAAFPLDQRLPPVAREALLAAMVPERVIGADGHERELAGGVPVDDGDALVVATSGSTGEPRGVVLTHAAVAASASATSERLGVGPDDGWLACLPLSHVGGLSVVTRALLSGTRLTVLPGFEPAAVHDAAGAGATLVSLVPTALARIDARWFRLVVLGGAHPPEDRPPNTVTTYGMTETGSGVVYDGVPLDGVDVRIDDTGEIHLRGPMLLRCYRDGSRPLDPEGWLATGDLGRWRPDGRLHVDGRRGELIITGGENVWPEPVEAVLRAHPAVADVAVTGRPDPEWGQRVTAVVVPADPTAPPTLERLRAHVKEALPAFCAPRSLVLVDSIPRTALGKVRRTALPTDPPAR